MKVTNEEIETYIELDNEVDKLQSKFNMLSNRQIQKLKLKYGYDTMKTYAAIEKNLRYYKNKSKEALCCSITFMLTALFIFFTDNMKIDLGIIVYGIVTITFFTACVIIFFKYKKLHNKIIKIKKNNSV